MSSLIGENILVCRRVATVGYKRLVDFFAIFGNRVIGLILRHSDSDCGCLALGNLTKIGFPIPLAFNQLKLEICVGLLVHGELFNAIAIAG